MIHVYLKKLILATQLCNYNYDRGPWLGGRLGGLQYLPQVQEFACLTESGPIGLMAPSV